MSYSDKEKELFDAINNDNKEQVEAALKEGADINTQQPKYPYETPLTLATTLGHIDIVKLLLENGADVNKYDKEYTPLLKAVAPRPEPFKPEHIDIAKLLLENGAEVNAKNKINYDNPTPLIEVVRAPLMRNKYKKILVELLLNNGADINAHTYTGMSPLMFAVSFENEELINLLLKNGADAIEYNKKKTPLTVINASLKQHEHNLNDTARIFYEGERTFHPEEDPYWYPQFLERKGRSERVLKTLEDAIEKQTKERKERNEKVAKNVFENARTKDGKTILFDKNTDGISGITGEYLSRGPGPTLGGKKKKTKKSKKSRKSKKKSNKKTRKH